MLESAYLVDPQTFNRYVYTGNNPVNFTDPFGLDYYQDNKTGVIKYIAGSDPQDGYKNVTGTAIEITGAGCDALGYCANVGDVLFFHSNSVEYLSELRQQQETRDSGTEVVGGIDPSLAPQYNNIVSDIILQKEKPIPQEAPAINQLLMGASQRLTFGSQKSTS